MFFDIFEKPSLSILNELIYSKFNHLICMQIDIMICYILHYTCMHTESMFYAKKLIFSIIQQKAHFCEQKN